MSDPGSVQPNPAEGRKLLAEHEETRGTGGVAVTGQPDERHEKLPAYYHAPTKTWVIRCSCGWRVREWEGTHEQHLIETNQGKRK